MKKKPILAVVWLCVLGGLLYGITHFGGGGGDDQKPGIGQQAAAQTPKLDTKKLTARWQDIVSHAVAPARGSASARYTLVEFGDFQCPQCGSVRPTLEAFLKKNAAQTNLIFVHRPFPFYNDGSVMHEWAMPSAQAAQAAAKLGKFWPMYDALYSHQEDLEPGFYGQYAQSCGMDKAQFQAVYQAPETKAKVDDSLKFTTALGIETTPTVLVHDNKTGRIWAYQGKNGTQKDPGIQTLVSRPPWASPPTV